MPEKFAADSIHPILLKGKNLALYPRVCWFVVRHEVERHKNGTWNIGHILTPLRFRFVANYEPKQIFGSAVASPS
ncbi:MAG: hypothetical protein NZ781_08135, partial [Armatimonadetes bacterium]|nr:hypothetical protein [Armatimonadota bacterium]